MTSEIEPVRWGIAGPGAIAGVFAEALKESASGVVARVLSRSPERAAAFAARHGGEAARDLEELAGDPRVEAVYVATPHPQHAPVVEAALEAGKAVLCEKPLTSSARATERLLELPRRSLLAEAWMYRFHPLIERLIEQLQFLRPRRMRSWFCFEAPWNPEGRLFAPELGGGAILDIGGYPVSLALLAARALGEEAWDRPRVEEVEARLAPTGVDGTARARLRWPSGFEAEVEASIQEERGCGAEFLGEDLPLSGSNWLSVAEPFLPEGKRRGRLGILRVKCGCLICPYPVKSDLDCYGLEAREFARALRSGATELEWPRVGLEETRAIARLLQAWREAAGAAPTPED